MENGCSEKKNEAYTLLESALIVTYLSQLLVSQKGLPTKGLARKVE